MVSKRRVPREQATGYVLELLERICAGGKYLDCITTVHAFGSWARGASEVGDVDLVITHDSRLNEEVNQEMVDNIVAGRDWNTPFRKELKPRRALQIMFGYLEMVAEPVLLYQRGDTLKDAEARVRAIAEDLEAGRAEREPVHPVLEQVADLLSRPSLILLTEMANRGFVELELIDLPDAKLSEIRNREYRLRVSRRWAATSPLARAATAAGAYLQRRSVKVSQVILLGGHGSTVRSAPWAVEAREGRLRDFVWDLGQACAGDWLYVIRPDLKRPLKAVRVRAVDRPALAEIRDLDSWLALNAPHIGRIG